MEDGITDVAANVREFLDAQTKDNPNLRTNAQIAEYTGLSESTISRLRAGTIQPSSLVVRQIAAAFGKTEKEVMGEPVVMCAGSEVIKDLMSIFDRRIRERQENTESLQAKLDSALEMIREKDKRILALETDKDHLTRDLETSKKWAIVCAVACIMLLVAIAAMLLYDLTHLDRGWFTRLFDRFGGANI